MTKTEIENAWYNFVFKTLNDVWANKWAVIFAEQNSPRPRLPYMTLKIISGGGKQTIDSCLFQEQTDAGETVFNSVRQLNYSLSIQSYGEGGVDAMNELIAGLDDPDLREILRVADIGGIRPNQPVDITAALPTKFEERCSLDVLFHSSHNKIVNLGTIESAEISGELVSNEDKIIETEQTIEGGH